MWANICDQYTACATLENLDHLQRQYNYNFKTFNPTATKIAHNNSNF